MYQVCGGTRLRGGTRLSTGGRIARIHFLYEDCHPHRRPVLALARGGGRFARLPGLQRRYHALVGQNAIDQSAHATALYSLDRQDFKNPATGQTIEASNEYNHQWLSSDGSTLIQTQDHNFDPNGQVYPGSQSWTELVPK